MKRITGLLRFLTGSFKIKLIVSLSGIILVVSSVTGILTYRSSMELLKDEIGKPYQRTNEDTLARLELNVREVNRIAQAIVFNPQIENRIRSIKERAGQERDDPFELYSDKKQIEEQIFQIKLEAPYITSMYLYDMEGNPAYFSFNTSVVDKLNREFYEDIRSRISRTSGDLAWMSLPLPSSLEASGYRQSVIVARWMKNSLLQTYGMLVMTMDEAFFRDGFKALQKDSTDEVYLLNAAGEQLYSSGPAGGELAVGLAELPVGLTFQGDRLYARSESSNGSFKLISVTSLEEVRVKNRSISRLILYSGIISVIISSGLIVLFTGRLLRPLGELVRGLQRVRNGDFETRIRVHTKDELAYIGDSFNAMSEQVGRLIREVYLTQLSEREAELQAVQAQLNPHFLHNLFNEMYWKLYLQEQKEAAALVKSIAETMNYALMPVRSWTTVEEELQHIRHVVKLHTDLFDTELTTDIQADPLALAGAVPRFLLQPLVENVFVHAFRDKPGGKRLTIRIIRQGNDLVMEVADNGCGMGASPKPAVREDSDSGSLSLLRGMKRESLGIRSVRKRVELIYGPPYGLQLQSVLGKGTTARLVLPYIEHGYGGADNAAG